MIWPRKIALAGGLERLDDLRLRLDHLVGQLVLERVPADRDEAVGDEVVEVGGDELDVQAAGLVADHREPPSDLARPDPERGRAVDVDDPLRPLVDEQLQDARLVGGELVDDPGEPGMNRVALVLDVGGAIEQLGRRARAGSGRGRRLARGRRAVRRAAPARPPASTASAPTSSASPSADRPASPSRSAARSPAPTPNDAPWYQAPAATRTSPGTAFSPGSNSPLLDRRRGAPPPAPAPRSAPRQLAAQDLAGGRLRDLLDPLDQPDLLLRRDLLRRRTPSVRRR